MLLLHSTIHTPTFDALNTNSPPAHCIVSLFCLVVSVSVLPYPCPLVPVLVLHRHPSPPPAYFDRSCFARTSLALDFPQHDTRSATLFARLDAIVREAGGRQYPAKDAHMSGADFRAAYPAWQALEQLRDPALMSRFWQRTTR